MKYYIDFEATQFSNEIIAIGCVREDGEEFYSLVKSEKKLTEFIIQLTGLTQEMISTAPGPNEVFKSFWEWCQTDPTTPEFYCYGNCDESFVKATFNKTTDFTAASMLSYLKMTLADYAPTVKAIFGLIKSISLIKMVEYFKGEPVTQRHNALEDAQMLKYVADCIENMDGGEQDDTYFTEWKTKTVIVSGKEEVVQNFTLPSGKELVLTKDESAKKFHRIRKGKIVQTYETAAEAVAWAYAQLPSETEKERVKLKNLFNNLRKASTKNTMYFGYKWRME